MFDAEAESAFASIAAALLQSGTRSAVAMGYNLYVSAAEVLFAVSESPLYVAVIDSDPAGRFFVVKVATPVGLSLADPTEVVPFLNKTVPVGAEGAVDVTVTFSVTACLKIEGFRLEVGTLVMEGYRVTTCASVPKLDLNVTSPA